MLAIKKYIWIAVIALISILGVTSYIQYSNIQNLREELEVSRSNEKAYIVENSGLKDENIAFKFTIDQLNYFNDSLTTKMNDMRNEMKIKDKDLKQLQYLLSQAEKRDTIVFRDTILKEPSSSLDTLMGDKWYKLELGLKFPSTIIVSPTFVSEKYIIASSKKETIKPPKKCAIARWFQKKHTVVEVDVIEKNPYIENKQQRFIEIID